MNDDSIMDYFFKTGVFNFFALRIKSWGPEFNTEMLPQARSPAYILCGRMAFISLPSLWPAIIPSLINSTAVCNPGGMNRPAVKHLDFVTSLQVHPGVGAFVHHEFQLKVDVSVLYVGKEVILAFI